MREALMHVAFVRDCVSSFIEEELCKTADVFSQMRKHRIEDERMGFKAE